MDIYASRCMIMPSEPVAGWRKAIQSFRWRYTPACGSKVASGDAVIGRAEALPYLRSKNNGKNNSNNGCVG